MLMHFKEIAPKVSLQVSFPNNLRCQKSHVQNFALKKVKKIFFFHLLSGRLREWWEWEHINIQREFLKFACKGGNTLFVLDTMQTIITLAKFVFLSGVPLGRFPVTLEQEMMTMCVNRTEDTDSNNNLLLSLFQVKRFPVTATLTQTPIIILQRLHENTWLKWDLVALVG